MYAQIDKDQRRLKRDKNRYSVGELVSGQTTLKSGDKLIQRECTEIC